MKTIREIELLLRNDIYQKFISLKEINGKVIIILKFEKESISEVLDYIRDFLLLDNEIHFIENIFCFNYTFNSKLNFKNCHFNQGISMHQCNFNALVEFNNSSFKIKSNFNKSNFDEIIRFHNCKFYTPITFENTTFNSLVDFYLSHFLEIQIFNLTDFLNITIFSNVTFHKQVQFIYNKIDSKTFISFENTIFKQSLDISRSNFWCSLQVWGIEVNIEPDEFWLYETDNIEKNTSKQTNVSLKRIRESYRRIKQEFRKSNNHIDSLKFQEYEINIYQKELKLEKNNIEDRIILWFNKNSNSFGRSWSKGLIFTLIVNTIFYLTFLFIISNQLSFELTSTGIGNFIKYFLQFLNVTIWKYEPYGINNYTWAYIILFIGRIFIGYGYYQTIQAFRKFSKN